MNCLGMQRTHLDTSYLMYVENSKAGIMKRSGMDVDLVTPMASLPMYNVSWAFLDVDIFHRLGK